MSGVTVIDDAFLERHSLGGLPPEAKASLIADARDALEMAAGQALSEGMSDGELAEFEAFIDRDEEVIVNWLEANVPNFEEDELFRQFRASAADGLPMTELLGEFCALKWLRMHRPDYRETVSRVSAELAQELVARGGEILAASLGLRGVGGEALGAWGRSVVTLDRSPAGRVEAVEDRRQGVVVLGSGFFGPRVDVRVEPGGVIASGLRRRPPAVSLAQ